MKKLTSIHFYPIVVVLILIGNGCRDISKSQIRNELLQTDKAFAKASIKVGMAEAFRQFLDEDAMQFTTGQPIIEGRSAIYEGLKPASMSTTLKWKPLGAEVASSGDMGYTWGSYTLTSKDTTLNTQEPISRGKYVTIWEKQKDGTWKVKIDIGNTN